MQRQIPAGIDLGIDRDDDNDQSQHSRHRSELHAYVDKRAAGGAAGDVEGGFRPIPTCGAVQSWRTMAETLHARYDSVVDEAVPKRLEIERPGAESRANGFLRRVAATLAAFIVGGGCRLDGAWRRGAPSAIGEFHGGCARCAPLYVVEVRHPVEVPGSERTHLPAMADKRCGWMSSALNWRLPMESWSADGCCPTDRTRILPDV